MIQPSPKNIFSLTTSIAAFVLMLLTCFSGWAADPDTRAFDLRTYYSPAGKLEDLHARFRNHTTKLFEKHGMTNVGYWVPVPNPDTGDPIPLHARGMAIPNVQPSGNPQWGRDSDGYFIITLNRTKGALIRVVPHSDATGAVTSLDIATLVTPTNSSRQFPFAAQVDRAQSYVLYEQNDKDPLIGPGIYWVDLAAPTVENRLTAPADGAMFTNLQTLAVTIYRFGFPAPRFAPTAMVAV